ncbi:MAG: flagellin FliC [Betaproteobacteria bacterium]|nr:flagellin FliC [Betaproteobacteria bacterium]
MPVINTNVSALLAQQAQTKNAREMSAAMQQLSSGSRINSAKDDAAGQAIGQNMTAQVRGLNQAIRNVNDGVNLAQTADGALSETANMLQRMRELAVQSSSGTYSNTQRGYLQTEFTALASQIDKVASETTWNGMTVLTGTTGSTATGTFTFQSGQASGQSISVSITSMTLTGLSMTAGAVGISSAASASSAIASIDTAIGLVNTQRAIIGAGINQMTYAADNLTNISGNIQASRSTIMDTDYATASTQLSKSQIIQQASTAMLAQANQQPQSVLALLK